MTRLRLFLFLGLLTVVMAYRWRAALHPAPSVARSAASRAPADETSSTRTTVAPVPGDAKSTATQSAPNAAATNAANAPGGAPRADASTQPAQLAMLARNASLGAQFRASLRTLPAPIATRAAMRPYRDDEKFAWARLYVAGARVLSTELAYPRLTGTDGGGGGGGNGNEPRFGSGNAELPFVKSVARNFPDKIPLEDFQAALTQKAATQGQVQRVSFSEKVWAIDRNDKLEARLAFDVDWVDAKQVHHRDTWWLNPEDGEVLQRASRVRF